jgi:hypothetical protein
MRHFCACKTIELYFREVAAIYKHEKFNLDLLWYDIALVKAVSPFSFTLEIRPIVMAQKQSFVQLGR